MQTWQYKARDTAFGHPAPPRYPIAMTTANAQTAPQALSQIQSSDVHRKMRNADSTNRPERAISPKSIKQSTAAEPLAAPTPAAS
jgi:hypothetical protein